MSVTAANRPALAPELAVAHARAVWGLAVDSARALPSDRDQNYLLTGADGRHVLKVCAFGESPAVMRQQHQALEAVRVQAPELASARSVATRHGEVFASLTVGSRQHLARVLTFVEGVPLAEVNPHTDELRHSVGAVVAQVGAAIARVAVDPPSAEFAWDLTRGDATIAARLGHVTDPARRALVERAQAAFAAALASHGRALPVVTLHNDANDHNVLVSAVRPGRDAARTRRAIGLIDFGDMVAGPRVFEVAIAAAYASVSAPDPLAASAAVVAGYHATTPLSASEIACVWPALRARLSLSVCVAATQRRAEPDHAYLAVSEAPAWNTLAHTDGISAALAEATLRGACALEPCAGHARVVAFLRAARGFAPVLGPELQHQRKVVIDWSPSSPDALVPDDAATTQRLAATVARTMADAGVAVAIGRYDEPRLVYATPAFLATDAHAEEARTVHLGLDIFAAAGTPVHAPLPGVVHSVADNRAPLDYGPTVILQHACADGTPFYTLYGHLARASVATLAPGQDVAGGASFARLGTADENGGWAPHLHLQVVVDLLSHSGDFPGVCRPAQRQVWKSLCPDPNLLARLPETTTYAWPDDAALRAERAQHLGFNLSLSYERPLHIVRGRGQVLYDSAGRRYLDAVNNVPHVGHCHPRVVAAATRQKAVLETNTRYLHGEVLRLAARLRATLPASLSVCFFVNSGSEANELALRLARAHTGRHDVVALEHGYHGNTTTLVEVSHYKFARRGGFAQREWVHLASCPDTYRAGLRDTPAAGETLARGVRDALAAATARGGAAAFVHESLPGCGGQIVPPADYLRAAYAHARAAGALCIADEVQTGLGRVGSAFWAFGLFDVVPDVVTIGKPLGNGHPVAAVVTTEAIARAFATGMEYFNTFGGSPASCAVAHAVLDVIEDEDLQTAARAVGAALLQDLRCLAAEFAVIGDVRGVGLYLGVELVSDRDLRTPATDQARYVVERLRDHGVLVSTDGPHDNVLKIKPPLCFTRADGERLVETLRRGLREDGAQPDLRHAAPR